MRDEQIGIKMNARTGLLVTKSIDSVVSVLQASDFQVSVLDLKFEILLVWIPEWMIWVSVSLLVLARVKNNVLLRLTEFAMPRPS